MVLNFPVGEAAFSLVPLTQFSSDRVFELQKQRFSGYIVATVDGFSGLEEGLLFLLEGKVVGCAYSLEYLDVVSFGSLGLAQFFNGLAAKHGIVDVYTLSKQQVELILALEDKIAVDEPLTGLKSLVVSKYNPETVKKSIPKTSEADSHRFEVLKKFELGELYK